MKSVLYSGGLDSGCALADCATKYPNETIVCLMFNYGQTSFYKELQHGIKFAESLGHPDIRIERVELPVYIPFLRGYEKPVPPILMGGKDKVANQGLAYRNFTMTMAALGISESIGSDELWVGFGYRQEGAITVWDSSFHAVDKLNEMINWKESLVQTSDVFVATAATEVATKIVSPMYNLDRNQYIQGRHMHFKLDLTWSCYFDGAQHCGTCSSCLNRYDGMFGAMR